MKLLQKFARDNKTLFWDTKPEGLDDTAILERVICYGNWDQYKHIEKILGKNRAKDIFVARGYMDRTNIREETINLFTHYFHVTPPSGRTLSRAI